MNPQALSFPPLHVELSRPLGLYYQDLEPAVDLVLSGFHGPMDAQGVPQVRYPGGVVAFNAITAAQFALALQIRVERGASHLRDQFRVVLDALIDQQTTEGPRAGFWEQRFDNPKYPHLRNPWISALAQGNGASALLRGWEVFGDDRYRAAAESGLEAMHRSPDEWDTTVDDGNDLWYEEYPAPHPTHVLNGHVYALLGVLDMARVSDDSIWESRWRRAADTTLRHLDDFDLGYWSAYDCGSREPVDRHYHRNIHIPQLWILAQLTGEAAFEERARRWERYDTGRVSTVRRHMNMRLRGLRARLRRLGTRAPNRDNG